jgi:hypothetical protein
MLILQWCLWIYHCVHIVMKIVSSHSCHLPLLYIGLECGLTNNVKLADKFFLQSQSIAPHDPFVIHEMGVICFQNHEWENNASSYTEIIDISIYILKKWMHSAASSWPTWACVIFCSMLALSLKLLACKCIHFSVTRELPVPSFCVFFFAIASRLALKSAHPAIQWVLGTLSLRINWPEHKAVHSPPSSATIMNAWNYSSTPQYVFMAWCLIKWCLVKLHNSL